MDRTEAHVAAYRFRGQGLQLAREFRGLSRSAVAGLVGKTASAISQYERDIFPPSATVILRLANALRVRPGFFTVSTERMLKEVCHFRKSVSIAAARHRQVLAFAEVMNRLLLVALSRVGYNVGQVSYELPSYPQIYSPEGAALEVRRAWGLADQPIRDMVALLEDRGFVLVALHEEDWLDAFSARLPDFSIIFVNIAQQSSSRTQFTLAHELGHLVLAAMNRPQNEKWAHRFAAAFLMPAESFAEDCPDRLIWPLFFAAKRRWVVSLATLLRRGKDLGRISQATYRRAITHLRKERWHIYEPDEPGISKPSNLYNILYTVERSIGESGLSDALYLHPEDLRALVGGEIEALDGGASLASRQLSLVFGTASLTQSGRLLDSN